MISINDKVDKEQQEEEPPSLGALLMPPKKEIRTMALFGDVDEEKSLYIVIGMLSLTEFSESESPYKPITVSYTHLTLPTTPNV